MGIPTLEMPDLALKFLQEFYFKKQFFFMERLKATELTHLSPIYRFKARQKNLLLFEESFKINFNVVDFLTFIKSSLEKFIPNASELWHLESNVPHLTIFKILKTLFEYSVFSKDEMMEILIILLDKAGVLRNLEKLVDFEHHGIHKSMSLDTTTTTMQEMDKIPFTKLEMELWVRSLMKIRQYYAEIFILGFLAVTDDEMVKILMTNANLIESFNFSDAKELSDSEKLHLNNLEKHVKYENLEIFNEDTGSSMMRVFFRYILVSSANSVIQITAKTKNIAKIFLSFFSNIYDINLSALLAMNTETFRFLKELPDFLEKDCPKDKATNVPVTVSAFSDVCINSYLLEKGVKSFSLNDFMNDFLNMKKLIGDISTTEVQLSLFMNGFLWVFLQTMRKFSDELCRPENNENKEKLINFLREIIPNNVFFMSKSLQSRFLKLISPERSENSSIYISVIGILFDKFPALIITNLTYLKFIFDVLFQTARTKDEDYEKLTTCLQFLQCFLRKKLYSSMRFLPHYDLLCLEQLFSNACDFGQKEIFNNLELLLTTRDHSPVKHLFFLKILQIIASATKTRYTKSSHITMSTRFTVRRLMNLFQQLSSEGNLLQNYDLHKVLLNLLRNLHIQASENIYDDKETRITYKKKKKGVQKKSDSLMEIENRFAMIKSTSEEMVEGDEKSPRKEKKTRHGTSEPMKRPEEESESEEIWGILWVELELVVECLKKGPILTENDKMKLKWYFFNLADCLNKKTKLEIQENYTYGRIHHFDHLMMGHHEKRKREKINEIYKILLDNQGKIQETFLINDYKKKNHDFELEVHGIIGPFQGLLRDYKDLDARCEFYCHEIKAKKKAFSAGELMKRFSNKLEDRQKSIFSPYEHLKESLKLNPNNKIGKLFAAIYESFKLKKLSTYSSIKKSDQNNDNIYMKILKESQEKKDGISLNFCQFIYSELFDARSEFQEMRPETHLRSTLSLLEITENNEDSNQIFQMKNRNYKYILIDFFTNVLFHATNTCQTEIFNLISQDFKVLDVIWEEIIFNLSYIYNQSHQGKHWKEAFMYSIMLIKTLQYFCEDNNFEFKKWIKEGFERKNSEDDLTKFEQIKEIFNRFFFRNDWGKKNWQIMKRKSLFPLVQALFDFLAEIMCGPCVEIQEILTREIFDFRMVGNLLNTFDEKNWEMIQGKHVDFENIEGATLVQLKEFNELKSSIADCLLVCCEGADEMVMDHQYKKFNLYEILDTIVNFGKLLCWRIVKSEAIGGCHTLINYWTYITLKKNFKKSQFNEGEQAVLDNALKLFIYLQNLSDQSFTLKHILDSKASLAKKNIMKHSMKPVNLFSRRKEDFFVGSALSSNERNSDLTMGFVIKFLNKIAAKIEIIDKDDSSANAESQSKYIFFKSSSDFGLLSTETKETFLQTVDRTSHGTKIHNLIVSCSYFEKEINIRREMIKFHPILVMKFSNFKKQELALFGLCVIINILM